MLPRCVVVFKEIFCTRFFLKLLFDKNLIIRSSNDVFIKNIRLVYQNLLIAHLTTFRFDCKFLKFLYKIYFADKNKRAEFSTWGPQVSIQLDSKMCNLFLSNRRFDIDSKSDDSTLDLSKLCKRLVKVMYNDSETSCSLLNNKLYGTEKRRRKRKCLCKKTQTQMLDANFYCPFFWIFYKRKLNNRIKI